MSYLLNESNIEITDVIIPYTETLENVAIFLKTMGKGLVNIKGIDPKDVITALNDGKIVIKGIRNESYLIAKQLGWEMTRRNPPHK